jgi:hypothetical protein
MEINYNNSHIVIAQKKVEDKYNDGVTTNNNSKNRYLTHFFGFLCE